MSGGDLDGDRFLVCWDPDIVPHIKPVEPLDYSVKPPGINDKEAIEKKVTYKEQDDLLRYEKFHEYSNLYIVSLWKRILC